jgi:predicted dehydrogenase
MTFSVAVIGCGGIAFSSHGPAYAHYAALHPEVNLSACCDTDLGRAEAFRLRFGFARAYTDFRQMLEHERPDAVCLNTPPETLCDLGCQVMQMGFPLHSEKPPGLTGAEIDKLHQTALQTGARHQVAFNRRFMPLAAELKRRSTGLTLHHLDAQFYRVGRRDADFSTTAIHAVDTVRFLLDSDFRSIHAHYQDLPSSDGEPHTQTILLTCEMTSGATASISLCPVSGMTVERYMVHAVDQSFILHTPTGSDTPGSLKHFDKGILAWEADGVQVSGSSEAFVLQGFWDEDRAFLDAIRLGLPASPGYAESRQSVWVMQMLREKQPFYDDRAFH